MMIEIPKISLKPSSRGGFWRRVFAILVDVILLSVLVDLVGVGLASVTAGQIRLDDTFVKYSTCLNVTKPDGLELPDGFTPTNITRCTKSFLGVSYDWKLNVVEQVQVRPGTTYTRSFSVPLDPNGQMARPFYLDSLLLPLLAVYAFLLEWRFGATVGKLVLRLRVRSLEAGPLHPGQVGRRTAMRMFPFLPLLLIFLLLMLIDPVKGASWLFQPTMVKFLSIAAVGGASVTLPILIFGLNFLVAARRRDLPWHDRWADTEVVRK
jgi:uncharacterized RDD family membrane protein YckC